MKRFLFTVLFANLFVILVYGQVGTLSQAYTPHSPIATELGKFVEVPVSQYTGIPNISLPLYELKLKNVSIPVSINYHSGGLKVKEIPGWIGANWSAEAGGVISRIVRGYPDDHYPRIPEDDVAMETRNLIASSVYAGFDKTFPAGLRHNMMITTPGIDTEDKRNHPEIGVDTEYDLFYFNFSGNVGQFTFNNTGKPILLTGNDLKIEYTNGKFKVIDGKGLQYFFDAIEQTNQDSPFSLEGPLYTTSWFLSKIVVPFTNETIGFSYKSYPNYQLYNQNYFNSYNQAYSVFVSRLKLVDYTLTNWAPGNLSDCPAYDVKFSSGLAGLTNGNSLFLDEISWEDKKVKFYGSTTRTDAYKYKLDSIRVLSADRILKRISFYQGYFNHLKGNPYKKMKLDSIRMNDQIYKFSYLESLHGIGVPPLHAGGQDLWGYYNGEWYNEESDYSHLTNQMMPDYKVFYSHYDPMAPYYLQNRTRAQKNPDPQYAALGTLTSIKYPTGGKTLFTFEGNTYSKFPFVDPMYATIEDDPFTQVIMSNLTGQRCYAYYSANQLNLQELNQTKDFIIHSDQLVGLNGRLGIDQGLTLEQYNQYVRNNLYFPLCQLQFEKYNDNTGLFENLENYSINPATTVGNPLDEWSYEQAKLDGTIFFSKTRFLEAGRYRIVCSVTSPGTNASLDLNLKFEYKNAPGIYKAGGLRIKKMEFISNSEPNPSYTKNYEYTDGNLSSGVIESPFANLSRSFYYGNEHQSGPTLEYRLQQICEFVDFNVNPVIPLGNAQGGVIGYKKVIENTSNNGKIISYFTNGDDDPLAADRFINSVYLPTRIRIDIDNSWKRGLLKQVDYYDNSNKLLKQNFTDYLEKYNLSERSVSLIIDDIRIYTSTSYTGTVNYISRFPRKSLIAGTKTIDYTPLGVQTAVTKYEYNDKHYYPVKISRLGSNSDSTLTFIKYPEDFNPGVNPSDDFSKGIKTLLDNHVVAQPIEKYVKLKYKGESPALTISGQLTAFHPTLPLPNQEYKLEIASPLSNYSPLNSLGEGTSKDTHYKPDASFVYDTQGYLKSIRRERSAFYSLIWGYKKQYLIAEVSNADSTQIAYSSFENKETNSWKTVNNMTDLQRNQSFNDSRSRTGKSCFTLGNTNGGLFNISSLNSSSSYIVSYWSKNTLPYIVTGTVGTPLKSADINGWVLFVHRVTGTQQVVITGQGDIDELRLYPESAEMKTYTYEPLVGLTSSTDSRNQTSTYEYDNFQRLLIVRDHRGNIIKRYDYNFKH